MAKPNSLLNEREREICKRVHFVRTEIVRWSQPDLARQLGITQNQLAGLEYARNPLRYGTARVLCDECHISQRWLATGNLPMRIFVDVHSNRDFKIPFNMLFSHAYEKYLSGLIDAELQSLAKAYHCKIVDLDIHRKKMGVRHSVGWFNLDEAKKYHSDLLNWRLDKQPENVQIEIFRQLGLVLDQLLPGKNRQLDKILQSKETLDIHFAILDSEAVKTKIRSLPDLINKLKELTKRRGQKAALARDLNVTRQAVDQWLSGNSKPTAETTLKLLNWVEQ